MAFSETQQRQLAGKLPASQVCSRREGEATLHYLEGWFAMAEANRIFGFDGWDRETLFLERIWSEAGKLPAWLRFCGPSAHPCESGR